MAEPLNPVAGAAKSEVRVRPFTLEEGLSPLNAYFDFTPEDRTGVMAALQLATKRLPTANEYHAARQEGAVGEMRMENRYGDLADVYAHSVDPKFTDDQKNTNSKTAENRRRFYKMVRTLTAEQVDLGIREILRMEAEQKLASGITSVVKTDDAQEVTKARSILKGYEETSL